jgi:hypothetical protein
MANPTHYRLTEYLKTLLDASIPYQFLPYTGLDVITPLCQEFGLPEPTVIRGNIIIGDLSNCDFVLSAHLDEVTFGIAHFLKDGVWLAPYHKYTPTKQVRSLTWLGLRNNTVVELERGNLTNIEGNPFYATKDKLRPGDRGIYNLPAVVENDLVIGKAVDDRVGVLITMLAAKELLSRGISVSVVLSDGECGNPESYFSRDFPRILPLLKGTATICFVDGIYQDSLELIGINEPPQEALIVPHSGYGKGCVVAPALFARLQDEIIPAAQRNGIAVQVTDAYRSRSDDWGMTINPAACADLSCFFVDFGAFGKSYVPPTTVNIACVNNCAQFITFAIESMTY